MSPNDPTLQEHQAEETSVRSEETPRPQEHPVENTSSPQAVGSADGPTGGRGDGGTGEPRPAEPSEAPDASSATGQSTEVPANDPAGLSGAEPSGPVSETPGEGPSSERPTVSPPPAASEIASEGEGATNVPEQAESTTSSESESGEASRPRVTLDRSATENDKPVPSLPGEESGGEDESGAGRPNAPVRGVDIPRSADLDPEMENELAAAMETPAADEPSALAAGEGDAAGPVNMDNLQPGTKLKGKVQLVGEETVFVDLGLRSPGMIATRQFPEDKRPETGQSIEVLVDTVDLDAGTVTVNLPRARRKPAGNWDAVAEGQIVDAMVSKTNKGGLEVTVSNLRGFLPASQVDLGYVPDLETYVGQKLTCVITEVNPKKKNLVLSRRAYLQQERKEKEKELWDTLAVGQEHSGQVKSIKNYGAFVDLGGIDGFLHVGEISWNRVGHPSDMLTVGQTIQVSILKLDPESRKIGLGMKQLTTNPWAEVEQRYPLGATVHGKVTRTADFGAFVELEEGVEGLIHISELEHRRVARVTEVVNVGDEVDVKVLAVEPKRKRISLSLKALQSKPEPEKKSNAPSPPPYERKRKGPLRGGRTDKPGSSPGPAGGLFGNPDDYR